LFATVVFGHSANSTNEQDSELVENNAKGKDPNSRCWDLGIGGHQPAIEPYQTRQSEGFGSRAIAEFASMVVNSVVMTRI